MGTDVKPIIRCFEEWTYHINGEMQSICTSVFIRFLEENGLYHYVTTVFYEAHPDPNGRHNTYRCYLRFTDPRNFVKNMHSNPPAEFSDLDMLWQEVLDGMGQPS